MRIARARRGFPTPQNVELNVDVPQRVRDAGVAVVVDRVAGLAGDLTKFRGRHSRGPAAGGDHLDIEERVQDLLREQRPLYEVDQVRADVREGLALFVDVEEPDRAEIRHTGYELEDVVHALHVDGGLLWSAGQ